MQQVLQMIPNPACVYLWCECPLLLMQTQERRTILSGLPGSKPDRCPVGCREAVDLPVSSTRSGDLAGLLTRSRISPPLNLPRYVRPVVLMHILIRDMSRSAMSINIGVRFFYPHFGNRAKNLRCLRWNDAQCKTTRNLTVIAKWFSLEILM